MARKVRRELALATIGFVSLTGSANAALLFFDDFNSIPQAPAGYIPSPPEAAPAGWTVTPGSGSIDGLPGTPGLYSNLCLGNTGCVDLDGTAGNGVSGAGQFHTVAAFNLVAGREYELSAMLGGNGRAGYEAGDTVQFGFLDAVLAPIAGGTATPVHVSGTNGFNFVSFVFTPSALQAGLAYIFFQNDGADNTGAILENVSLTEVPLPAAGWLLLSGLGALGAFARQRRQTPTPA